MRTVLKCLTWFLDVDDCALASLFICGENKVCKNTQGDYECDCEPGYESVSGDQGSETVCEGTFFDYWLTVFTNNYIQRKNRLNQRQNWHKIPWKTLAKHSLVVIKYYSSVDWRQKRANRGGDNPCYQSKAECSVWSFLSSHSSSSSSLLSLCRRRHRHHRRRVAVVTVTIVVGVLLSDRPLSYCCTTNH